MTEAEWLASTDPEAMLGEVTAPHNSDLPNPGWRVSPRKLRLFACACVRLLWWGKIKDDCSRQALEVAERHADGKATRQERDKADRAAAEAEDLAWRNPWAADRRDLAAALVLALFRPGDALRSAQTVSLAAGDYPRQAALLRDIVGNPFRPVALPGWRTRLTDGSVTYHDCPWLTPTVLALAREAYDLRQGDGLLDDHRLGVLADALEDAGTPARVPCDCLNDWCRDGVPHPLLSHLRSPGPHARGCWALDLLLGKE